MIPQSIPRNMLKRIHSSHIGVEGCLRRPRVCLYWLRMSAEVKEHTSTSRTYETKHAKETLMSHEVPQRPWEHWIWPVHFKQLWLFSDSGLLQWLLWVGQTSKNKGCKCYQINQRPFSNSVMEFQNSLFLTMDLSTSQIYSNYLQENGTSNISRLIHTIVSKW